MAKGNESQAPAIEGQRQAGEEATEETPAPVSSIVESDPRLADITEEVRTHVLLVFSRGTHSVTYEFGEEPSDAVKAGYRKQAEETMDQLDAQRTQELQDRRRPK